jgi:putative ABC transport system ATP-binding protein
VAIARARVRHPTVIFADEPTAALDRDLAMQVVGFLKKDDARARHHGLDGHP